MMVGIQVGLGEPRKGENELSMKKILLAVQITIELVVFLGIQNRDVMKYAKYVKKYGKYAKCVILKKICRICTVTPHFADVSLRLVAAIRVTES